MPILNKVILYDNYGKYTGTQFAALLKENPTLFNEDIRELHDMLNESTIDNMSEVFVDKYPFKPEKENIDKVKANKPTFASLLDEMDYYSNLYEKKLDLEAQARELEPIIFGRKNMDIGRAHFSLRMSSLFLWLFSILSALILLFILKTDTFTTFSSSPVLNSFSLLFWGSIVTFVSYYLLRRSLTIAGRKLSPVYLGKEDVIKQIEEHNDNLRTFLIERVQQQNEYWDIRDEIDLINTEFYLSDIPMTLLNHYPMNLLEKFVQSGLVSNMKEAVIRVEERLLQENILDSQLEASEAARRAEIASRDLVLELEQSRQETKNHYDRLEKEISKSNRINEKVSDKLGEISINTDPRYK
jgi:membrane protein implicated in regulation of membrane protease activity